MPPTWRAKAQHLVTIWRQPSFDPYASWTAFNASDIWVRRVVADQREAFRPLGDVEIYVADALAERDANAALDPPRSSGIVLDGMRLGIRTNDIDIWWHSHLATPLNRVWLQAWRVLDTRMPACTIAIQSAHQWIEAS